MSIEDFDTCRFSINTEVLVDNYGWAKVIGVDFENREIGIETGEYINIARVQEFREG